MACKIESLVNEQFTSLEGSVSVQQAAELMGIVNLRQIAHELARHGAGCNLFVGLTVAASLAVIGLLIYQLPAMLRVAERVS